MTVSFGIDVETGILLLGDVRLRPRHDREEAAIAMQSLSPAFPFGHVQTAVLNVAFAELPSWLTLAFREDQLADVSLSVGNDFAPGLEAKKQVDFVRGILFREFQIDVRDIAAKYAWGAVYSYVTRGHGAAHGVKYGPNAYVEVINEI